MESPYPETILKILQGFVGLQQAGPVPITGMMRTVPSAALEVTLNRPLIDLEVRR